ncbi:hypothetical protein [Nostoc sp.]|uniref:hypothetical protein n=1 Tax=Nostoc sp. TaxID=1180 RepID=UPI002FFC50E3
MSKHEYVLQQKRQTLENLAIAPTDLSLSTAAFSNGEIQSHETGCESLQQPEVN